MIRVASDELDNLELRMRLLAGHKDTTRSTASRCYAAAKALRALSLRLNEDADTKRIDGPDVLEIEDWQAAYVVAGKKL